MVTSITSHGTPDPRENSRLRETNTPTESPQQNDSCLVNGHNKKKD